MIPFPILSIRLKVPECECMSAHVVPNLRPSKVGSQGTLCKTPKWALVTHLGIGSRTSLSPDLKGEVSWVYQLQTS